jgi:hypothetical protein
MVSDYHDPIDDMLGVLALYQPYAEKRGFGASWKRMCEYRTSDSAYLASQAAWAYSASDAAMSASDAAMSATIALSSQQEVMVKAAQEAIDGISKAIAIEKRLQHEHPAPHKIEKTEVEFNDAAAPKTEKVEVELSDAELLGLMKMAHELDITFNEFCQRVLQEYIATSRFGGDVATETAI